MKTIQRGFVVPILLIIGILVVGSIIYNSSKNHKPNFSSEEAVRADRAFDAFDQILQKYEKMKVTQNNYDEVVANFNMEIGQFNQEWLSGKTIDIPNSNQKETQYFISKIKNLQKRELDFLQACAQTKAKFGF